jgi:mannose-1-phosphate guanylyltransferase/mannose-6-phosphate isomerase
MHGLILAGGSGTRFWPKSRETHPKQLLKITGSRTLIQETVERLLPLIPARNLQVITNEAYAFETCRQLLPYGFEPGQLLAEPEGKNTAVAVGLAAQMLASTYPDEVLAVFPADHVVKDPDDFHRVLREGERTAAAGHLVTLGIRPTRPETGFGYIKLGAPLKGFSQSYHVDRFVEKPDLPLALKFLQETDYYWNCGIFLWKVSTILAEIKTHLPAIHEKLAALVSHIQPTRGKYMFRVVDEKGKKLFASLPSISVDHGVLEKSAQVAVLPTQLAWSDVGSWSALEEVFAKDENGNVFTSNVVAVETRDTIIQGEDRLIAAVGVHNLVIVDTPDALLVCDKSRAQDVKKVVQIIKDRKLPQAASDSTVQKPWGTYTVLEKRPSYLVKRIDVHPGEKLSLQSHQHRSEHWTVTAGQAEVQRDGKTILLQPNESTFIPHGSKHRLGNPGKTPLTLIEIQIGESLDEDDITRYQDDYGRA